MSGGQPSAPNIVESRNEAINIKRRTESTERYGEKKKKKKNRISNIKKWLFRFQHRQHKIEIKIWTCDCRIVCWPWTQNQFSKCCWSFTGFMCRIRHCVCVCAYSFGTFFLFDSSIFVFSLCHVMKFCLDRAFHFWKFNIWKLIKKSIENMCLFYVRTLLLDVYIRREKIEKKNNSVWNDPQSFDIRIKWNRTNEQQQPFNWKYSTLLKAILSRFAVRFNVKWGISIKQLSTEWFPRCLVRDTIQWTSMNIFFSEAEQFDTDDDVIIRPINPQL